MNTNSCVECGNHQCVPTATCLQAVSDTVTELDGVDDKDNLHIAMKTLASNLGISSKKILAPTRIALTGMKVGGACNIAIQYLIFLNDLWCVCRMVLQYMT